MLPIPQFYDPDLQLSDACVCVRCLPYSLPGSRRERSLLRSFARMAPELLRHSAAPELGMRFKESLRNAHKPDERTHAAPRVHERRLGEEAAAAAKKKKTLWDEDDDNDVSATNDRGDAMDFDDADADAFGDDLFLSF